MLLEKWLSEKALLKIADEIAQPVTSFVVESNESYSIRWFAVGGEINLCGHGSLGAGAALIDERGINEILLQSRYGNITIEKKKGFYQMRLPGWRAEPYKPNAIINKLGLSPIDMFATRDLVVVLDSKDAVISFEPDFELISQIEGCHAFIVTAQSGSSEYVLRYFAPKIGISEDLATGSAQCSLAPYWFDKLGISILSVRQLSGSGGYFMVESGTQGSILISAHVKERSNNVRINAI